MKRLLLAALTTGLLMPSVAQANWFKFSPDCSKKEFSTEELTKRSKPGVVVVLTDKASGSGFVVRHINNQTLILTNSHVITRAKKILVQWPDGTQDRAVVVLDGGARTTLTDLALLKIQGKEGEVLPLKKGQITVGGDVIALGAAPKGLAFSLTKGVVSSLRDEGKIIQTDTAINPGSSGGPLINNSGCVVGVNTLGMTKSVGLNFAISSQTAQRFIDNYAPDNPPSIISKENQSIKLFTSKLEHALNSKAENRFEKLFANEALSETKNRHDAFLKRFSNTKWSVSQLKGIGGETNFLEVLINGEKLINEENYKLFSQQLISLKTLNNKISSYEVVSEYSILKSIETPLEVKVSIPNSVLTGSRYDADIILEKPLGNAFISGGLIVIEERKNQNQTDPFIDLYPIGAGGLFKSVQAPLKPGSQILVGLITHPKGIISITKIVKVVEKKEDMIL
tara:strand:+ start:4859 stop:6217 length:1359 start_codon:yes stop_codon:yes gene_type:complete